MYHIQITLHTINYLTVCCPKMMSQIKGGGAIHVNHNCSFLWNIMAAFNIRIWSWSAIIYYEMLPETVSFASNVYFSWFFLSFDCNRTSFSNQLSYHNINYIAHTWSYLEHWLCDLKIPYLGSNPQNTPNQGLWEKHYVMHHRWPLLLYHRQHHSIV